MKFDFENFIVISKGSSLEDFKNDDGSYTCTIEGAKIYPLETALPIMIVGQGCPGVGWITEYKVSTVSTTIKFNKLIFTDPKVLEAYYILYKAIAVAGDPFAPEDAIIPGLKKRKSGKVPRNKFRVNTDGYSRSSSDKKFIDSLDDLDDEDDSEDVASFFRGLKEF